MSATLLYLVGSIWKGQTLVRALMNKSFEDFELYGRVADIGGGRSPDYFSHFHKASISRIEPVDGSINGIDFEKDRLPYRDLDIDVVVCCNLLEHIYNYQPLVLEMHRILRNGGAIIGFVPFLVNYHPDPHDYFRYTKESLQKIMENGGFKDVDIREVGGGPFAANYNNIVLSVPRIVRVLLLFPYLAMDKLFLALRPKARLRYPLGYLFFGRK